MMLKLEQDERPSIEQLVNQPQISLRLRERKIKEHYSMIKKKEEEIKKREIDVKSKEEQLLKREKELEMKEKEFEQRQKIFEDLSDKPPTKSNHSS